MNRFELNPLENAYTTRLASSLPHALTTFSELKHNIGNKKIFIFLDYDGTLTPIVSQPKNALIPSHVLELLHELSLHHFVAIVTGRGKDTIRQFINLTPSQDSPIALITSHGFSVEYLMPKQAQASNCSKKPHSEISSINHVVGKEDLPYLNSFKEQIQNDLKNYTGVNLEDNVFSISIHYRNAIQSQVPSLEEKIDQILENFPMLKKTFGKMVFEIRLNFEWNKGKAILWLLNSLGYSSQSTEIFLIYFGDDLTDEDAFREIKEYNNSFSILVGSETERHTYAQQRLSNPDEVYQYLKLLKSL